MKMNVVQCDVRKEWREVTVEEIAAPHGHAMSTGPFGSSISSRYFRDSGVPVIRGGNLSEDVGVRLNDSGLVFLSPEKATEFKRSTVRNGDLVFTCWGTINQVGLIDNQARYPEYIISNKQMKLTPDREKASSLFLYYTFSGPELQARILDQSIGSSIPGFNLGQLRSMRLRLPPLPEQRAIAAALSDVDALLAQLDALIAKKRAIKTATMQRLLTGQQRLPGFSGAWETRRLGDISEVVAGQSPSSRHYNYAGEGLPLIQGKADLSARRSISRVWTTLCPKTCGAGELMLTVRAPVGHVAIASVASCLGRGVCGLRPAAVNPTFLFQALVFAESKWQTVEQGSTFTSASTRQVADFEVPVPPSMNEQEAIARVFSNMDAEIEALEARREKTQAVKQGMMQELLTGRTRLV